MEKYDAFLLVSFGGPEKREDVLPFLENVLRGKNVPRERMLAVAEHYYHFDGVSPINAQNRALLAAVERDLRENGVDLPVYWGNRNWSPYFAETLSQMRDDGVRRAVAFFTSAYSSYSGCRQYRENLTAARDEVGEGAPAVFKLRAFFNHPGFIEAMEARLTESVGQLRQTTPADVPVLFTAHSIPLSMATGCRYEPQLQETCRILAERLGLANWRLVYQSRSGPPTQPWLEPDILQALEQVRASGAKEAIVCPVGFISDHMEVLYDLDCEAKDFCDAHGIAMVRTPTVGTHPRFVRMITELVQERMAEAAERPALGRFPASHDVCPADCCLYTPARPPGVGASPAGQRPVG
ncbi:MAG TPA: ferrochelatase [Pirellulaceae bacterium]|nr:ferrochelatase [Pirellulaceae bacterium]